MAEIKKRLASTGLIMPKRDRRDFSYKKYFGAGLPLEIPDFEVGTQFPVKDQGVSDACTAFALASVSEDQEEKELEPAYGFAKTKQIMGSWQSWGADPRSALKSVINYGSLEVGVSPYSFQTNGRNFCADWKNWDPNLDGVAKIHRKHSFMTLDGQGDLFDSIRSIMYQHKDSDRTSAFVGIYWQPEWTYAPGGVVEHYGPDRSLGHALKIVGQKTIDGIPYLKVKNSWNVAVGDAGYYYFSREVANNLVFAYGVFDISPETVKRETWTLLDYFVNWLRKLILPAPVVPPVVPPPITNDTPPIIPTPGPNKLKEFADAIQQYEGWTLNPPSRSVKNHNPGNLRFTAYTKLLGAISADKGGFCVFPSDDKGYQALCQFIQDCAANQIKGMHDRTILTFFQVYAPASDGNAPRAYADFVASKVGVNVNTYLKDII